MKKIINSLVLFLVVTLGGVPVVYAGCMDDAGDAIAAFFSGGISYATCQMIETVESMIRVVQTVTSSMERMTREAISTAQRGVNETANSIATNTNNMMRQLSNMANEANQMVSSLEAAGRSATTQKIKSLSTGATAIQKTRINREALRGLQQSTASASPPAPANELRAAMRQGADMLVSIHTQAANQAANQVLGAMDQAKNMAMRHADSARRIAETSVMAPLRQLEDMLAGLVRDPARIFDPTSLVNETVERITLAMTQVTEQIHHEIMNEALATIRDVDQHVRRIVGDTDRATQLHAAMDRAKRQRDQQSLNALRALLGTDQGTGMKTAARKPTAVSSVKQAKASSLQLPGKSASDLQMRLNTSLKQSDSSLQTHIEALRREVGKFDQQRKLVLKPILPAGVEKRAQGELNRMLANKTPTEANAIKRQLKQQLLQRMNSNPKAAAEIDQRFDQRYVQLSRAILPASQTAPIRSMPLQTAPTIRQPVMSRH